jgi:steroid delta-isomerase-like uncharacterized protein
VGLSAPPVRYQLAMSIDTTTLLDENKRVARAFIDRVFVRGEPEAIDELATEDFTPHTFGTMQPGRQPLKEVLPRMAQGLKDPRFDIEDVIAEGDRVAVRLTARATHVGDYMGMPASGNRYAIPEIHIFRIRDGQVSEHWHAFDRAALMEQLKPKG